MKIYLKLRNGKWILVNSKLEYITNSSEKKIVKHVLAGETVDMVPRIKHARTLLIPSTNVSKFISRVFDEGKSNSGVVIVEPYNQEHFIVKADGSSLHVVEQVLKELAKCKKGTMSKEELS